MLSNTDLVKKKNFRSELTGGPYNTEFIEFHLFRNPWVFYTRHINDTEIKLPGLRELYLWSSPVSHKRCIS